VSYVLEDHGSRPLTVNKVANLHRQQWAALTRQHRLTWQLIARQHQVPALGRITVTAEPLHKDRRSPQDVAACAPAVKAAIDGLVDAGIIPDDSPEFVTQVRFLPPVVCGVDGLRLTVEAA
jgi:crossover junction endodeoxyribonuclease RusA